jgi:hypothetical protein
MTVPAGTIKGRNGSGLDSDFMFDIEEPELFAGAELEFAGAALFAVSEPLGLLIGAAEEVLSFELDGLESDDFLLQPITTKERQRPRVSATKRVRMIPPCQDDFCKS